MSIGRTEWGLRFWSRALKHTIGTKGDKGCGLVSAHWELHDKAKLSDFSFVKRVRLDQDVQYSTFLHFFI